MGANQETVTAPHCGHARLTCLAWSVIVRDSTPFPDLEQMRYMLNRYTVQRQVSLEGKTLSFVVFLGSRKRGWKRFDVAAVRASGDLVPYARTATVLATVR